MHHSVHQCMSKTTAGGATGSQTSDQRKKIQQKNPNKTPGQSVFLYSRKTKVDTT